jgi:hypothetical protein
VVNAGFSRRLPELIVPLWKDTTTVKVGLPSYQGLFTRWACFAEKCRDISFGSIQIT